jgi:predicted ATPase/class 3 adenylate cyclase
MVSFPAGIVTFLFTDIEGSTPLWEQHPAAMRVALDHHDAILHQTIAIHSGQVFKLVGDAFQAAFTLPAQAVQAAIVAQQGLSVKSWDPETGPVKVRMGIHTGPAEVHGAEYSGHTLNRVSRVMSAAFGGQILLSQEAADLVRWDLAPGVSLKDLGDHRLKGLSQPERLFQVVAPGLRQDFPLLPTRVERPNNLPPQLTSFVGREKEIAFVCEELLLAEVRLLTLSGVGGTGKTRLALQVGQQLLESFQEGVFFVPLAPVHEAHLVVPSIAETLGLRESPNLSSFNLLKEFFAGKQMLLILDNFEQVLEAGPFLTGLLAAAPRLKILVTSRTLLRLAVEHDHPVSPLSLPELKAGGSLGKIEGNEAVQLFVQRARSVKPDFRFNEENAAVVAEICRRLDGLPLAIELAAAHCRMLTPQKMLDQLGKRLKLLVGGARDTPERHQTMRAAIDWSYALLSAEEQVLFRRLSVFAGGCFLEAVEGVCGFDGIDVIAGLESLLDKNLIRQLEMNGEPRFWMYETIREYGLELLESSEEMDTLRQGHARYYIVFMNRFSQEFNRLETELDNLRAILRWSIESNNVVLGYRVMSDFWFWGDRASEGRRWLEELLALPGPPGHYLLRAFSIFSSVILAIHQGDFQTGRIAIEEVESIAQNLSNETLLHLAQYGKAYLLYGERKYLEGLQSLLDLEKKMDKNREWWIISWVYFGVSATMFFMRKHEQALEYLKSALDMFEMHNHYLGIADCIILKGFYALEQKDYGRARALFQDGLSMAINRGFRRRMGSCIWGFAGLALGTGDLARSARLFGAAEALIKITGSRFSTINEKAIIERNLLILRDKLDERTFAGAWQEGLQMSLVEAIAYAHEG